jgi:trk system potassium uptake protein TrkH
MSTTPRATRSLHPTRLVPLAFLAVSLIGTGLLSTPLARAGGEEGAPFIVALFTSVSAVCVTGLTIVDTGSYWSPAGHAILLILVQIGGLGILTGATLLGLLVSRRLQLSSRLATQAETRTLTLGDARPVLGTVLVIALACECLGALLLAPSFASEEGVSPAGAAWYALFHAVSAFNNAGLTIIPGGAADAFADPWLTSVILTLVVLGGIGAPVYLELMRSLRRPSRWSLHAKMTITATLILLFGAWPFFLTYEWNNPLTLGAMDPLSRPLQALFHSAMTRSGGFNAFDTGDLHPASLAVTQGLMLIGGGSAGTAGGIKVTTLLVLVLAAWAEIRGDADATAFGRRIPEHTQRQALAIALASLFILAIGVSGLLSVSDMAFERLTFEAVSAFATVGLSTGAASELPPSGQLILVSLMLIGRVGVVTFAAALALRAQKTPFRYPEEPPIVG